MQCKLLWVKVSAKWINENDTIKIYCMLVSWHTELLLLPLSWGNIIAKYEYWVQTLNCFFFTPDDKHYSGFDWEPSCPLANGAWRYFFPGIICLLFSSCSASLRDYRAHSAYSEFLCLIQSAAVFEAHNRPLDDCCAEPTQWCTGLGRHSNL